MHDCQNGTRTKVVLVTSSSDESTWEIIRYLENSSRVRLLVIEKKLSLIQWIVTRIKLISTRFSIFFRKTVFSEMHPPTIAPTIGSYRCFAKNLDQPEVLKKILDYRPNIIIGSRIDLLPKSIVSLDMLFLAYSPGISPFYCGPYSLQNTIQDKNYNYFFASIYGYESAKLSGSIVTAQYLCPYYREPLRLYKRRLDLIGAKLLIDVVTNWPSASSAMYVFHQEASWFEYSNGRLDSNLRGGPNFYSRDLQRYVLYQRYGSSLTRLSDSLSRLPATYSTSSLGESRMNSAVTRVSGTTIRQIKKVAALCIQKQIDRNNICNGFYVLNYHQICPDTEVLHLKDKGRHNIYTSESNFLSHLQFLNNGFQCVPLDEGIELWRNGEARHERIASITIDDGLKAPVRWLDEMNNVNLKPSLFLCGNPIIRKRPLEIHKSLLTHQYMANNSEYVETMDEMYTAMVANGFSDDNHFSRFISECYLCEEDVQRLLRENQIGLLGSHTWSHPWLFQRNSDLTSIENFENQSCEIVECHNSMRKLFGAHLQLFSYPFGKMDYQSFVSELLAHRTCSNVFQLNGGINVKPSSTGSILRIGAKDFGSEVLEQLLRIQWAR
jgi:hypothetical protein